MKPLLTRCVRIVALLGLLALSACVSNGPPDVTVAGDRTTQGENFRMPTAEVPYYYYLVCVGPQAWGPSIAGEDAPPPQSEVEPFIVDALAKQHYIRATTETAPPSLVIGYAWGTVNVDEIDFGETDEEGNPVGPTQLNRKQMMALVTTRHTDTSPNSIDMRLSVPDLDEGRHFILIGVYDINDFPKVGEEDADLDAGGRSDKQKKRARPKPLWRMKLSTPSRSTSLAEALPSLLESGREFFGQDQDLPETIAGKVKEGKVSIGELVIMPDENAKKPDAAQQPATQQGQTPAPQQTPPAQPQSGEATPSEE